MADHPTSTLDWTTLPQVRLRTRRRRAAPVAWPQSVYATLSQAECVNSIRFLGRLSANMFQVRYYLAYAVLCAPPRTQAFGI